MADPLLNNSRDEREFVGLMEVAQARHETFRNKFFKFLAADLRGYSRTYFLDFPGRPTGFS
jgi:hypothetical protein